MRGRKRHKKKRLQKLAKLAWYAQEIESILTCRKYGFWSNMLGFWILWGFPTESEPVYSVIVE